ncbi:spermatogenesis-associated protein 6 [Nylanderia fulva]|uniref:spermatogenesis-associated protein 6 n=1 Tax=Nylanderia fulva TaxID=613905 RepID=UPI0010FB34E9|nr:spermatogenesis-associated protein 6 [Nylanderia fulva]
MAGRAFRIKVQLDVHAVTCPGVWLCPNGKVALQIDALDSCVESRKINPIFPLLFHDRFTFSKIFVQTASLADLQRILEREFLFAELIQWTTSTHRRGITLATFEINLSDLLYPASCFKGLLAGVDVDLLMEPTKCFPGIIAPKIEVSTKTIVEEVSGSYDTSMSKCYVINPKMINSKQTTCGQRKRPVKGIIRQRRVCHTKPRSQSCRPYRQRSSSVGESPHCDTTSQCIDQCYHSVRKDPRPCVRRQAEADIVRDDDIHVTDNCPVCLKYNCYFSKCDDDSDVAKRCSDIKRQCHRRLLDTGECCCVCRSSDERERARVSLLQAKIRNLQKAREKMCVTEPMIQLDIEESDPSVCEYSRDHSRGYEFYKDLEKFYKRMYKQAKLRAQEVDC